MSDKDFKVKNKLVLSGLTGGAGPLISDSNKLIDSTAYITTAYGGTGTTTSPTTGQILYSSAGTTYSPSTLTTLDVKGSSYSSSAPSSPVTGQIWVDSSSVDASFDTNIIRRQSFTATASQTVFTTTVSFIDGYEQVFFNGMLLLRTTDYTTSNSNTITLASGAAVNDIIEVVTVTNLNSVNTYTQAEINSAILIAVPSQTGNSGKYLTTNGTISSWATIDLSSYLASATAASTYATITNVNNIEIANIMGAY